MQSTFVTGASGFIGRHLVAALVDRGIRVRCLVRSTSKVAHLQHPLVELVHGELPSAGELRTAIDGVDAVFHLAGLTHALHRDDFYRINGKSCGVIADACRGLSTPPPLIYLSSLAAAGPSPEGASIRREEHEPRPISDYGRSKRLGEIEIQRRAADLSCTIVRPGIVFGPSDRATVIMFKSIYRYRLHMVVGFRTPHLSLIHVNDLVQLILRAAESGERIEATPDGAYSPQGYYFACDDSEYPNYWELGKRVATALNRRVFVWPLWRWVGRIVAGVHQLAYRLRGRSGPVNIDKIREATASSWACSCEKARKQLAFSPSDNLDSWFKRTADWYLDNGWL